MKGVIGMEQIKQSIVELLNGIDNADVLVVILELLKLQGK